MLTRFDYMPKHVNQRQNTSNISGLACFDILDMRRHFERTLALKEQSVCAAREALGAITGTMVIFAVLDVRNLGKSHRNASTWPDSP